MDEFDFLLEDRIAKIKAINEQYDLENNSFLSFSGGKDSTIVHYLLDLALPNNKIPRVYANTGIEFQDIVEFVKELAKNDDRFVILKPTKPIKKTLEKVGFPFKSKQHSDCVAIYQKHKDKFEIEKQKIENDKSLLTNYDYIHNLPLGVKTIIKYYYGVRERERESYTSLTVLRVPNILKYQFEKDFNLKLSKKCCYEFKKEPFNNYEKEYNKTIHITGMRKEEGGTRTQISSCILTKNDKLYAFHPLLVVDSEWENQFIKTFNVKLCKLYYPPYNFERTGCKGCPYNINIQKELDTLEQFLPNEKKQCEIIWKPVYDEYRRLGYRLRKQERDLFNYNELDKKQGEEI